MLRVSLFLNRLHQTLGDDLRSYVTAGRIADEAGLYGLHMGDHVVMGGRIDRYPYGKYPVEVEAAWMEPLTTLAAIAAVTSKIRLSAGVVIVPLRPAVLLAKTLATLDVLSAGRLEIGIGTGWQREEYEAQGLDWSRRYTYFDDTVRACRALWGGEFTTFRSETVSFEQLISRPAPVQRRLPLWYGTAATDANVARIAELGDGWCPVNLTPAELREGIARIKQAFQERGRDASALQVRVALRGEFDAQGRIDIPRTLAKAPPYLEAGATVIGIGPPTELRSIEAYAQFIEALARESGRYQALNQRRSAL